MKSIKTPLLVAISIIVHAGIFAFIGSLVYFFKVKWPDQLEQREIRVEEQAWLDSAVEEIKYSDGVTEKNIRLKMPESILDEVRGMTNPPPDQSMDKSQYTFERKKQ